MLKKMRNTILVGLIVILGLGNVFFAYQLINKQDQGGTMKAGEETVDTVKESSLDFLKLFIVKVINDEKEVSFEDRLQLENAVREIGDQTILAQWQKFIESETGDEAQKNTRLLMEMLVNRL